ncbi:NACHT domain-containing protein [Saccharopolyspora gregorii]|uniref:NACHT domain-containing protein n=1 Tax=Saccharopolyspora gregorii TaxID=33914 RepID=UPI0031EFB51C
MTEHDRARNTNRGTVGGDLVQVGGDVHGDLVVHPEPPAPTGSPEASARELARRLAALSRQEGERWGLGDPEALPVRWHPAADELVDHWDNIQHDEARPPSLTGSFAEIRRTYRDIDSQRLVILGRAGAGKTALVHRLVLDLIAERGRTGRVPVLFGLGDWNPTTTALRSRLADLLERDHPFLVGGKAAALVADEWVLPVLDGFDEIPERYRRGAVREISRLVSPVVVTSRRDEYADAVRQDWVRGAAVIELDDLRPNEVARHLRRSSGQARAAEWAAVFEHVRTEPDAAESRNLAAALTTPLLVTLARLNHDDADRDPAELLDADRFRSAEQLEEHLLSVYLNTRYDPVRRPGPWRPDQAHRWLGRLATDLVRRGSHDLAWWRMPAALHRRTRVLVTTVAFALCFGAPGLLLGLWGQFTATWFGIGLLTGLSAELRTWYSGEHEPERVRLHLRRPGSKRRPQGRGLVRWFAFVFVIALLFGGAVAFAGGFTNGLVAATAFAVAFGLAGTMRMIFDDRARRTTPLRTHPMLGVLVVVLVAVLESVLAAGVVAAAVAAFAPGIAADSVVALAGTLAGALANGSVSALGEDQADDATDPWHLLRADRAVALGRAAVLVLATGLTAVVAGWVTGELGYGLVFGAVTGSMLAVTRVALSSWGGWLLFARLWLPLTGRLPWRPTRFLDDAYARGVLRRAGAVHQFRHARLRDHLADTAR